MCIVWLILITTRRYLAFPVCLSPPFPFCHLLTRIGISESVTHLLTNLSHADFTPTIVFIAQKLAPRGLQKTNQTVYKFDLFPRRVLVFDVHLRIGRNDSSESNIARMFVASRASSQQDIVGAILRIRRGRNTTLLVVLVLVLHCKSTESPAAFLLEDRAQAAQY